MRQAVATRPALVALPGAQAARWSTALRRRQIPAPTDPADAPDFDPESRGPSKKAREFQQSVAS
jgi:hypothetical protein